MRARRLVAGCALAGAAALTAAGAARAKSDVATAGKLQPAVRVAAADAGSLLNWVGGACGEAQTQGTAERAKVQAAAQPLADRLVTLVVGPRPLPALPATGAEDVTGLPRPGPASGAPPLDSHQLLKGLLAAAATRHGLDPGLVMAVAWWESGWNMSRVSDTGAVGIMQIDPATARDLGPKLLNREIDIHDPYDNADLGAAVLRADLADSGGSLSVALAAYYEGGGNVDPAALDANAQVYVAGVTALQKAFDAGEDPALTPSP